MPTWALDAVLDQTADFYGIALADTVTDENLLLFETHIAGLAKPAMLFIPLIGTPANVVAEDPSRVALGTLTIQDAAGGFTVVATGVSLQKIPDRVFDRTATNLVYTFLATTISEQ